MNKVLIFLFMIILLFSSIPFFSSQVSAAPSSMIYQAPITIDNTQSTPTPNPFQQMIQLSESTYKSYITYSGSTANFEFSYANNTIIPAWIESNNSGKLTIWLKIYSIPASSSITIYIDFASLTTNLLSSSGTIGIGEAPQLSPTYAEYDNGASVFDMYFNGNTPLSDFNSESNTLTQASVTGPSGTTINVISITGYASNFGFVYTAESLTNQPLIAESSSQHAGNQAGGLGADNGQVSIVSGTSTSDLNAISVDMGYHLSDNDYSYFSNDYYSDGSQTYDVNQQGTDNTNWHYASVTYYGSSATSWSGYIAPQLYSTTGGYSGTVSNNPLSSSPTLYLGLIGSVNSNDQWQTYINWMRARSYPPNDVMPSVSFGSVMPTYTVTFTESGLPSGAKWNVTLNGVELSSSTSSILFSEPDGTYSYTVGIYQGYSTSPYSSSVTVSGANVNVAITFTQVKYSVTFTESGLPSGTSWSVTLSGSTLSSTSSSIVFTEPNGAYSYSIGAVTRYTASPSSGSVTVSGTSLNVAVTFTFEQIHPPAHYRAYFNETGLPEGTTWGITILRHNYTSDTSDISINLPNGRYAFTVIPVPGYTANPSNGTLYILDGSAVIDITFIPVSSVQFSVEGLPSNMIWSVTLDGITKSTDGTVITFAVTPGNYTYSVNLPEGYSAFGYNGNLHIQNSTVNIKISASPIETADQFGISYAYIMVALVSAVIILIGAVLVEIKKLSKYK